MQQQREVCPAPATIHRKRQPIRRHPDRLNAQTRRHDEQVRAFLKKSAAKNFC
jgi:hypothetical protein